LLLSISWKTLYANSLEANAINSSIFLSFSNWSQLFHVWPRFQNFRPQLLLLWACLRNSTSNVNVHLNCTFWRCWPPSQILTVPNYR
jgi:hypothetical protein